METPGGMDHRGVVNRAGQARYIDRDRGEMSDTGRVPEIGDYREPPWRTSNVSGAFRGEEAGTEGPARSQSETEEGSSLDLCRIGRLAGRESEVMTQWKRGVDSIDGETVRGWGEREQPPGRTERSDRRGEGGEGARPVPPSSVKTEGGEGLGRSSERLSSFQKSIQAWERDSQPDNIPPRSGRHPVPPPAEVRTFRQCQEVRVTPQQAAKSSGHWELVPTEPLLRPGGGGCGSAAEGSIDHGIDKGKAGRRKGQHPNRLPMITDPERLDHNYLSMTEPAWTMKGGGTDEPTSGHFEEATTTILILDKKNTLLEFAKRVEKAAREGPGGDPFASAEWSEEEKGLLKVVIFVIGNAATSLASVKQAITLVSYIGSSEGMRRRAKEDSSFTIGGPYKPFSSVPLGGLFRVVVFKLHCLPTLREGLAKSEARFAIPATCIRSSIKTMQCGTEEEGKVAKRIRTAVATYLGADVDRILVHLEKPAFSFDNDRMSGAGYRLGDEAVARVAARVRAGTIEERRLEELLSQGTWLKMGGDGEPGALTTAYEYTGKFENPIYKARNVDSNDGQGAIGGTRQTAQMTRSAQKYAKIHSGAQHGLRHSALLLAWFHAKMAGDVQKAEEKEGVPPDQRLWCPSVANWGPNPRQSQVIMTGSLSIVDSPLGMEYASKEAKMKSQAKERGEFTAHSWPVFTTKVATDASSGITTGEVTVMAAHGTSSGVLRVLGSSGGRVDPARRITKTMAQATKVTIMVGLDPRSDMVKTIKDLGRSKGGTRGEANNLSLEEKIVNMVCGENVESSWVLSCLEKGSVTNVVAAIENLSEGQLTVSITFKSALEAAKAVVAAQDGEVVLAGVHKESWDEAKWSPPFSHIEAYTALMDLAHIEIEKNKKEAMSMMEKDSLVEASSETAELGAGQSGGGDASNDKSGPQVADSEPGEGDKAKTTRVASGSYGLSDDMAHDAHAHGGRDSPGSHAAPKAGATLGSTSHSARREQTESQTTSEGGGTEQQDHAGKDKKYAEEEATTALPLLAQSVNPEGGGVDLRGDNDNKGGGGQTLRLRNLQRASARWAWRPISPSGQRESPITLTMERLLLSARLKAERRRRARERLLAKSS